MTWGLLVTWTVHDAEELFTMVPWSRSRLPKLRSELPWVPERVWRAVAVENTTEAVVSVLAVGTVIAAAAAAGAATDGRSPFFQIVLAGFGLHTIGHVASAAVSRGYTPGVVTAVLVAAPFSAWAWSRLSAAGLTGPLSGSDLLLAVAAVPVVIGGARALGRLVAIRSAG